MSECSLSKKISPPSDQELAVAATVLYSSLFKYPLSEDEIRQNLLFFSANGDSIFETYSRSSWLQGRISVRDGFFVPVGCEKWIQLREKRRIASLELLRNHSRILKSICALPFTRLVALSGSISHLNIGPDGDLDLMIVTEAKHVWSVAVAVILLARAFHRRRTICVNFLLSRTSLKIVGEDLFSATELIHLRPLIGSDLLRQFLDSNTFIREFFPEFGCHDVEPMLRLGWFGRFAKRCLEVILQQGPGQLLEWFCRHAYSRYLLARAPNWTTPEDVALDGDRLKLHSHSHRHHILSEFEKLLIREVGDPDCLRLTTRLHGPAASRPVSESPQPEMVER